MLCGISVVFNSLGDVFALVSCQRGSENRQVLMGFQSTETLGRFQHAGGCPAYRHRQPLTLRQTRRTVPMMFSIALVQASERRSGWQFEVSNGQHLVEPFEKAGGDPSACCSSRRARLRCPAGFACSIAMN